MSRYPAPILKRGEISLILILVILLLAGAPMLFSRRSSVPEDVSITPDIEIDSDERVGTPTWEIGAQKVANTCGHHYGSPPELEDLSQTDYDFLMRHLVVSEKLKLLYCYIPKVGCANWKRLLAQVEEADDIKRLSTFSQSEQIFMLNNYYKVTWTRHPIDRLVSAYRNKFGEIETFQKRYGVSIVEKFRPKSEPRTGLGNDVTFSEFIEYLTDMKDLPRTKWDEHWSPMVNLCQPCNVHYDGIGQFETLQEESSALLTSLNSPVKYPDLQHWYHPTTENLVTDHYFQLNQTLQKSIHSLYNSDFSTFQYEYFTISGT